MEGGRVVVLMLQVVHPMGIGPGSVEWIGGRIGSPQEGEGRSSEAHEEKDLGGRNHCSWPANL